MATRGGFDQPQPLDLEAVDTAVASRLGDHAGSTASGPDHPGWLKRHQLHLLQVGAVVTILGLWQGLVAAGWLNPLIVSSPSKGFAALIDYFRGESALSDISISGREALWGILLAIVVGVPVGLVMGMSRVIEAMSMPIMVFLLAAPRIAFIPIFVIWLGIGQGSKIALTFLMAVIPVIINARAGVTFTDRDLLRVCRAFGGTRLQAFSKVILPSAVPSIVAGMRLGIANGLVAVVVGELYAATGGVGYAMGQAGSLFQTDKVIALVFLVGIAGVIASAALGQVERHFDRWRPAKTG